MPVQITLLEPHEIVLISAVAPFRFDDLYERAVSDLEENANPALFGLPFIMDLRQADLLASTSADIRGLLRKRKSLGVKAADNPCCFIAGDIGSFGMLRMYVAYSEAEGLRREENAFVTMELFEGVEWLLKHLKRPGSDAASLLTEINLQVV